jgi:hypothetical protein
VGLLIFCVILTLSTVRVIISPSAAFPGKIGVSGQCIATFAIRPPWTIVTSVESASLVKQPVPCVEPIFLFKSVPCVEPILLFKSIFLVKPTAFVNAISPLKAIRTITEAVRIAAAGEVPPVITAKSPCRYTSVAVFSLRRRAIAIAVSSWIALNWSFE